MKKIALMVSLLILCFNFSKACLQPNLGNICLKNFEETIICNGQVVTNHKIVLTYSNSCGTQYDEHFWIKLGVAGGTGAYPLKFEHSSVINGNWVGFYSVTISEYNVSGGNCTNNPDWPSISQAFFDDQGNISCNQQYIYTYYAANSITQPSSFPYSQRGFVCCESTVDNGLTYEATACIGSNGEGQQFIKVTVPDYYASQYDITIGNCSVPPSANQGTMYLYAEINGSWNMMGLVANCRYQQNGGTAGSPWDYYFNVSGLDLTQCYQYFVSYLPDIIGHTIPDFAKTACKCCDANFQYTATTNSNVVTFQAMDLTGVHSWTLGNGYSFNSATVSYIYPVGGSYNVCHYVGDLNHPPTCSNCTKVCVDSVSERNDTSGGANCDANFSYTVNTENNWVTVQASDPYQTGPYKFDMGDGTIINASSVSYQYASPGAYSICLTVGGFGGCRVCADICQVGPGRSGGEIHPLEKIVQSPSAPINIWPNPITSNLSIGLTLEADEAVKISLFDMTGRNIYSFSKYLSKGYNEETISMGSLTKGVYLLQIQYKDVSFREKVLKE